MLLLVLCPFVGVRAVHSVEHLVGAQSRLVDVALVGGVVVVFGEGVAVVPEAAACRGRAGGGAPGSGLGGRRGQAPPVGLPCTAAAAPAPSGCIVAFTASASPAIARLVSVTRVVALAPQSVHGLSSLYAVVRWCRVLPCHGDDGGRPGVEALATTAFALARAGRRPEQEEAELARRNRHAIGIEERWAATRERGGREKG